ncbi:hypothetical protein PF006_g4880 [Phytophthora fragariae]|uniref:Uncharacterized protein n=2 Tax=Phytophthora TaxID=4783 RepID=A0A6A3UHV5_9STRA|nr:hypothetical protein PF009_g14891 [Phytophthora fragariae]KAE9045340.1 hypothetical protein PR001_g5019 [Phytophthora rubi]KAE9150757.1 hypothetical protein PF006_g4880 [Phytophthora fragariae]KAE9224627.1 hypothetical protein PF004_g12158 [Phytophthora fragariae]
MITRDARTDVAVDPAVDAGQLQVSERGLRGLLQRHLLLLQRHLLLLQRRDSGLGGISLSFERQGALLQASYLQFQLVFSRARTSS